MEILQSTFITLQEKVRGIETNGVVSAAKKHLLDFLQTIKDIGITETMDDYDRRKLNIFNLLNFFQLFTGLVLPLIGMAHHDAIPVSMWVLACLPSVLSLSVLILNHYQRYHHAQLSYFILYPFFTGFVYLQGMNAGVELHFILYGVLAVFFLQDMGYMLFTIALTMINYFILSVLLKDFIYEVKERTGCCTSSITFLPSDLFSTASS